MNSLVWRYIDQSQMQALGKAVGSVTEIRSLLAQFLLDEPSEIVRRSSSTNVTEDNSLTEREHILVDFYFFSYSFAKDLHFDDAKASCFLSIMKELLLSDMRSGMRSVDQSFNRLRDILLRHACERSPLAVGIFSKQEVDRIVREVTHSYYRHFKLFHAVFTPKRTLVLEQKVPGHIRRATLPRALSSGVSQGRHMRIDSLNNVVIEVEGHGETETSAEDVIHESPLMDSFMTTYASIYDRLHLTYDEAKQTLSNDPVEELSYAWSKRGVREPPWMVIVLLHVGLLMNGTDESSFMDSEGHASWNDMKERTGLETDFSSKLLQFEPLAARDVLKSHRTWRMRDLLREVRETDFSSNQTKPFVRLLHFMRHALELRYESMLKRVPIGIYMARKGYKN